MQAIEGIDLKPEKKREAQFINYASLKTCRTDHSWGFS
jgi:hypothetical protein